MQDLSFEQSTLNKMGWHKVEAMHILTMHIPAYTASSSKRALHCVAKLHLLQ